MTGATPAGRGIVYVSVDDDTRARGAVGSCSALRSRMPDVPVALATNCAVQPTGSATVIPLAAQRNHTLTWIEALRRSPFDKTLFLADDAHLCVHPGELFDLLEAFDMALPHLRSAPGSTSDAIPTCFPALDCGVILARSGPVLDAFVDHWERCAQGLPAGGGALSSGESLRLALFRQTGLEWTVLPPECNCRFEEPGVLIGPPAIVRGEVPPERLESAAATLRSSLASAAPAVHLASQLLRARSTSIELVASLGSAPSSTLPAESHSLPAYRGEPASRAAAAGDRLLVYVVGMHRSGTSAIAGLLDRLGLRVLGEGDLMRPDRWNPRGYFESKTMQNVNDKLLAALGGTWSSPPEMPAGWHRDRPEIRALLPSLEQIAANLAPPAVPSLWKDPRLCLTLPLWRDALRRPQAAVLVYRHPAEVADSLYSRDQIHPAQSLALWEHYTRSALAALEGMRVAVVRYEDVIDSPLECCATLAQLLAAEGEPGAPEPPFDEPSAFIDAALRRERSNMSAGANLLPSQAELIDLLDARRGMHDTWTPPEVLSDSSWVSGMLQWT